MKLSFIWFVIAISCSVCASGELEIFPSHALPFGEIEKIIGRSHGYRNPYKSGWSLQNYPLDVYEKARQNQNILEYELPQELILDDDSDEKLGQDLPTYYTPKQRLEEYLRYMNFKNKAPILDQLPFSSNAILNDVRPYPQDEDFTFLDDGDAEGAFEDSPAAESIITIPMIKDLNTRVPETTFQKEDPPSTHHGSRHQMERNQEGSFEEDVIETDRDRAIKAARLVDDPAEFAYMPSDPRFYESPTNDIYGVLSSRSDSHDIPQPKGEIPENDKTIDVYHRSDVSFLQGLKYKPDDDTNMNENWMQSQDGVHVVPIAENKGKAGLSQVHFIAIVAGLSAAIVVGLAAAGFGWYRLQKRVKNAADVEYPAYGITGPNKEISASSGDRKLAQSAQMYHYQHQKQQIVAMEKASGDKHNSISDLDSDEENEEGDYTVYECPGLAPTGEMEVKNPLFQDDPASAETIKPKVDEKESKK